MRWRWIVVYICQAVKWWGLNIHHFYWHHVLEYAKQVENTVLLKTTLSVTINWKMKNLEFHVPLDAQKWICLDNHLQASQSGCDKNTIVTCVVCILNYCGFYPIYNSDEHWKMPRKLSYAQQKPEVAVVDRNCAGCVQGKWARLHHYDQQASEVCIFLNYFLIHNLVNSLYSDKLRSY